MRVKNVDNNIKVSELLILFMGSIYPAIVTVGYYFFLNSDMGLLHFGKNMAKYILHSGLMLKSLFVFAPMVFFATFVVCAIYDLVKLYRLNKNLYVKNIEFLEDKVQIAYNKKENNSELEYRNIKKFTLKVFTKNGFSNTTKFINICGINLIFSTEDGKKLIIKTTGNLDFIYKLLSYKKNFKRFECVINGPTDVIGEKIKFYDRYQEKKLIAENNIKTTKFVSLMLFLVCLILFVILEKTLIISPIFAIIPLFMLLLSIIPDINLMHDEFIKKRIRGI